MSSPASTGPAGANFEAQVGAHYLLTLLIGAEPRGLPGTSIDRVEFQRGPEGHPLDDIVVHAHDRQGNNAVLEIQVKRTVSFAPSDREFKKIVGQISEVSRDDRFQSRKHELAVAVAHTSQRIDASYQDVLTWARQLGSHDSFFRRINRSGSANCSMRTFVRTFRDDLREAGLADNDETVWLLLSRFQILPFDYAAQGSLVESWDKERASQVLHSDASHQAANLWGRLIELVLDTASSAGEFEPVGLRKVLGGSFRLSGSHQYATARTALAEAARHALDDINDQVRHASLFRTDRLDAVRAALTRGRYVEIRGDGGVGKSALLKHFARQLAHESPIMVLSPKRTTRGGWTAMRSVLGFDGSARNLLVDLASSGGATLFLDGLDFFTDSEQLTVKDLVREASEVPGFNVIATARRDFGQEEPSWLPSAALDNLGRTESVMVGELSTAEVRELRAIAPEVGALLAESHPARSVTRNLFRLSRLTNLPVDRQVLRTEVDMAEQWWKSADGTRNALHRHRARVLKDLSKQTLGRREPLDTKSHPPSAVDALVQSQTLRDLGSDRMVFHHDVLRDWAVANLLHSHPDFQDRLSLTQSAPAALVRGVELAARMALERNADGSRWRELLAKVSHEDVHGSWRRAVLLAPVRSEIDVTPLDAVSDILLADQGRVLRELIGTVLAVDGRAASEFAGEIDILEDLYIPIAPSWIRLIRWLLTVGENVPPKAIPDVARLYAGWCALGVGAPRKIRMILWVFSRGGNMPPAEISKHYDGLFVPDGERICKSVLKVLYRWLVKIEDSRYPDDIRQIRLPFSGSLSNEEVYSLEGRLRASFLALCYHTPLLAAQYVRSLLTRGQQAQGVRLNVVRAPGTLACAASDELAQLAVAALVPHDKDKNDRSLRHPPFLSVIHHYSPPSRDHRPFIDLLTHAPRVGLRLVRRLVDYAVSYYTERKPDGANLVSLPFPDGYRAFGWPKTYGWARASRSRDFCVTSALMALSKWGQQRIQNGESVGAVLSDILGESSNPAAFLLVGIDLLLNAWPASRESAIPFVACPELLCLDRSLVWSEYLTERLPGRVVENPHPRTADFRSLLDLFEDYAVSGPPELRKRLVSLLRAASERLGPFSEDSSLNDPAFMASHALNRLDPDNWKQRAENPADDTVPMEYVAPEAEARHLAHLEDQSRPEVHVATLHAAIMVAVENATRASSDLTAAAIKWAQRVPDDSPEHRWAVAGSALLLVRDGDNDVRARNEEWARLVFADVTPKDLNPQYEATDTFAMNPAAIAFVGTTHLLKCRSTRPADIRALLDLAARRDGAGAPGFAAAASILGGVNERLPRAVLRTVFASCVRPRDSGLLVSATQRDALVERYQQRVRSAIEEELAWLRGDQPEPVWPQLTRLEPHIEEGIPFSIDARSEMRQPSTKPPQEYVDHQCVARWLNSSRSLFSVAEQPWLRHLADAYALWTAVANGFGRCKHDKVDVTALGEWNESYFRLVAHCLPGMDLTEVDAFVLNSLTELPNSSFVSIADQFLLHVDNQYFNEVLTEAQAVHIRSVLIDRLIRCDDWKHRPDEWMSIEVNLGRLVARMFMHDGWTPPPRCYLRPDGVDRLAPLLPGLQRLAVSGPCFLPALNLIEVDPRPNHLQFIVAAAESWVNAYPDNSDLWRDHLIGRRICGLINTIRGHQPSILSGDANLRKRIDGVLVSLTSLGVPEAAVLEQELANASG